MLSVVLTLLLFLLVDSANSLAGDWAAAKVALRKPDCCVVSVSGLEDHLSILQAEWNAAPADLDLRTRVHVQSSLSDDCQRIYRSVSMNNDGGKEHACTAALEELARGVASLADGPLEGVCEDVFLRVVCASDYRAIDPMYHTDKCPLRGYVTLRGQGTEFMTRPSPPMEYAALRTFGQKGGGSSSCRNAQELEFIVMKGDYYQANKNNDTSYLSWKERLWTRTSSCVHRSPPGIGGRRVIVSLDLADGDDDQEWYQANKKREWRSGMTQRKSRLVA